MNCTRCGAAEAVVQRENAFYCGRCVLARDWEEVIALVQRERIDVATTTVEFASDEVGATAAVGNEVSVSGADPYS